jgi:hypothetical protein
MIEKEFIPYEEALTLKELGFDEPCLFLYNSSHDEPKTFLANPAYARDWNTLYVHITNKHLMSAPTYSQAFRWLLKHHNLYGVIIPTETMNWTFKTMTVVESIVEVPPYKHVDANDYGTPEEAELSCLKKLIEIVKNEKK